MKSIRLRYLAEVNPATKEFDALADDAELTFMPLETVWADGRHDASRMAVKSDVTMGYTRFRDGDVLLPKVTPTFQAGRVARVEGLAGGVGAGTTELHVLRARRGIDPRYVAYALRSKHFIEEGVTAFQGVAGLQRVPERFVRDFEVADLSLTEQRRIADFLDTQTSKIDLLIDAHRRQVMTLDERIVQYARRLTTVGLSPHPATRATGIAWMPEMSVDWTLWRVGHAFRTSSGTTPPSTERQYYDGSIPWVNTGDLRDGPVDQPAKSVTALALATYSSLRLYQPGALVVAMYGATIGRLGILTQAACVNQACCVLHSPSSVQVSYAFYWFLAHRSHIVALGEGGGQPNISQEAVRSLRIPAPTLVEQDVIVEAIGQRAEHAEDLTRTVERQIALLIERRQALITAAVTGQLDVTTARGVE